MTHMLRVEEKAKDNHYTPQRLLDNLNTTLVCCTGLARLAASIVVAATSCLKYDRLLLHMAAITGYSLVTIFIIFADNQVRNLR